MTPSRCRSPNILDDFQQLQRDVADARRRRDTAAGAKAAALKRLSDEFGCADETAARKLLAKLEKDERKLAADYSASRDEFEKKWEAILNPSPEQLAKIVAENREASERYRRKHPQG